MKKFIKMISVIAAVLSLVLAMSVPSFALTDARDVLSSGTILVDTGDVVSSYEALIKKAYQADSDMKVIGKDDMPEQVEVKYVQSKYGYCIKACLDPRGEDDFARIDDGTEVYVFYRAGGYAFVMTEDGLVCWCKSSLLKDSFDEQLSEENRLALDAQNGLYG